MLCSHEVIAQTIIFYNSANNKKCFRYRSTGVKINVKWSAESCCVGEIACRLKCESLFLCVDIIKIF